MDADSIAAYLKSAPGPVTLKKLEKDLRRPVGKSAGRLDAYPTLADAVRSGAVFEWPRYKGSARYWDRDPAVTVRDAALAIASDCALAKKDLVVQTLRRAYNCGRKAAEDGIAALVKAGALRIAKTVGPGLYYRPDKAGALVEASIAALMARLRKLGIDGLGSDPPPPVNNQAAPQDDPLLHTIAKLQPAPGVPVTVQSLRSALPSLSKRDFDASVIALADRQKIYLITHDHGWALSETEREQLVWDGGQKLYVAVTLRD